MVMAVALSQSAFAGMLRFLGEPCMGTDKRIPYTAVYRVSAQREGLID